MTLVIMNIVVIMWFMIMGLVLIAFRRSAMVLAGSGIHHIMAGVFWIICGGVLRGFFWDVIPLFFIERETFLEALSFIDPVRWPNICFYTVMGLGGLRLMYGFWLMLPEEDRSQYNILTAAFYPKKLWITIKERDK